MTGLISIIHALQTCLLFEAQLQRDRSWTGQIFEPAHPQRTLCCWSDLRAETCSPRGQRGYLSLPWPQSTSHFWAFPHTPLMLPLPSLGGSALLSITSTCSHQRAAPRARATRRRTQSEHLSRATSATYHRRLTNQLAPSGFCSFFASRW